MVLVRLKGILSPAELQLSEEPGGVEMIKQMRSRLVESCAAELTAIVAAETGCRVTSMHADISARSGERVFVKLGGSVITDTRSSGSCPPAPDVSSTWRASWRTGRRSSCWTSPHRASLNARWKRWRR